MEKLVSTAGMERKEWLRQRKKGIGGSDAGAVCGLNPYVSPVQVYLDKISDEISDYDNEAMRQGRDLEEYVARRFTEATGKKVRRANMIYGNSKYPFMFANVDRFVVGENAGLECKTASAYNSDKWEDNEIPPHYLIQCYHYMAVTNAKAWYIAVVILGKEFKFQKISRDEAVIQNLIQVESDFWNNHVLKRIMPEPDGSSASEEVLKRYFPQSDGETILLPEDFNEKLERRTELEKLIRKLDVEKKQIEQEVKMYMNTAENGRNNKFAVSWKNIDTMKLDALRLKKENPAVYSQYLKEQKSRRFMVKEL